MVPDRASSEPEDASVLFEAALDPRQWLTHDAGADALSETSMAVAAEARATAAIRASFGGAQREQTERSYPLHGVAFHYLAQVHPAPDTTTRPVGYIRRGAQFRARRLGTPVAGCPDGFYELAEGGFVCRGEGFLIGETPRNFHPAPPAADRAEALPYAYRRVAQPTFQYWRRPTDDEAEGLEGLATERTREGDAKPTGPGLETESESMSEPPRTEEEATQARDDAGRESERPWPDFVRFDMPKGFYVSVPKTDRTQPFGTGAGNEGPTLDTAHPPDAAEDGPTFATTLRGTFVPDAPLSEAVTAPGSYGVALSRGGAWRLPVAFIARTAQRFAYAPETGHLSPADALSRTAVSIVEQRRIGREDFVIDSEGYLLKARQLRVARALTRPTEVPEGSQWIHVDLGSQTLVAYEGNEPVFATLVATGKRGFETPEGVFKLESKHVSVTMDGDASQEERYRIEDVPWTMYFSGSYALHGAFWHDRFGSPRSHGCVNLTPADARWLFDWSTPTVPSALHGRYVARGEGATFVVITSDKTGDAEP